MDLAVAVDVRVPAVVLVPRASDLLDAFPKADALVALLSLPFQHMEHLSFSQAASPAISCCTLSSQE